MEKKAGKAPTLPNDPEVTELERVRELRPEDRDRAEKDPGNPERVKALITGKLQAPNKHMARIVERIREAKMELESMAGEIDRVKQMLNVMERRRIAVTAIHSRYMADLKEWDQEDTWPT